MPKCENVFELDLSSAVSTFRIYLLDIMWKADTGAEHIQEKSFD